MGRAVQMFLSEEFSSETEHGGDLRRGKRKTRRPIATKRSMHFVLRSERAKGRWSFLQKANAAFIRRLLPKLAKKFHVTLYEMSTNSNHIHLLLRGKTKEGIQKFLMVSSGQIAQRITGAKKGNPLGKRFFEKIPFSRIVEWGKAFEIARRYVWQNVLEAAGIIPYQPRNKKPRGTVSKGARPPTG